MTLHSTVSPASTLRSALPPLELVRASIGAGAQITGCRLGPETLLASGIASDLRAGGHGRARDVHLGAALVDTHFLAHWDARQGATEPSKLEAVSAFAPGLAAVTADIVRRGAFPLVLGGDHSTAVGTWSGIADAYRVQYGDAGRIGLIWIDAHLDSHTPETSESQAPHGMPLAALLGHGAPALTDVRGWRGKVRPENVAVVGVRSFEEGEAALLARLGVRVFGMEEVQARGLDACLEEAVDIAARGTVGYGVSFDVDAIDPQEAMAVGSPEAGGIAAHDAISAMPRFAHDARLIGFELVEYNPERDGTLDDAGNASDATNDTLSDRVSHDADRRHAVWDSVPPTAGICRALLCAALCPGWQEDDTRRLIRLGAQPHAQTQAATI
jgi:arginase